MLALHIESVQSELYTNVIDVVQADMKVQLKCYCSSSNFITSEKNLTVFADSKAPLSRQWAPTGKKLPGLC